MKEVVVYLSSDYKTNESIWVSGDLSKEEIKEKVNKEFGLKGWFSYDILPF
jgi:hypothetical protein